MRWFTSLISIGKMGRKIPEKIVITGGPGSGKTSVVDALEADGYTCFHEIIRTFTMEAKKGVEAVESKNNPIAFVDDSLQFNTKLLQGRLAQFNESDSVSSPHVFFDRGMPDVLAYMEYFNQEYPQSFVDLCMENRYDRILILPPWKEIYNTDNERFENWEVAFEIYDYLKTAYEDLGYEVIDVPRYGIEERKEFIVKLITSES